MAEGPIVVGYASRLSLRPGETIRFHVGADVEADGTDYEADVVRLRCVDLQPDGPGFREEPIASAIAGRYRARRQRTDRGSRAVVPAADVLADLEAFTLQIALWPTRPGGRRQALMGTWDEVSRSGFALFIDERGIPGLVVGDGRGTVAELSSERPLRPRQWVRLTASYDARSGFATLVQAPRPDSPAERLVSHPIARTASLPRARPPSPSGPLVFAAWQEGRDDRGPRYGAHFDGKLEAPRIARGLPAAADIACWDAPTPPAEGSADLVGFWDFGRGPDGRVIADLSTNGLDGRLENLPTRAVTGIRWDGTEHDWRHAPDQYAAIHFHADDLYDAGWEAAFELEIPRDWRSAVYAVRLRCGSNLAYVPFFVAPPKGVARAKLAFLVPTATYLAYANMPDPHAIVRRLFAGAGSGSVSKHALDELIAEASEFGPSCYQSHSDGSGVHHASHLRPVSNLAPRPDLWAWNADMSIVDWLEAQGFDYDVLSDELLHAEGAELLEPYRVVVTGTHPEYTSTAMLDALEAHLGAGGRLVYLGANGFYWRIAFSDAWPGAIELRRAEDGTRAWESRPGEYHHAWSGELGGLWRRIGRPPNRLVGVGFTAQGFASASSYRRRPAASDPRAAFVFEGVDGEEIGLHGRLGGAAGEEIDRFDPLLGSPPHALVLASASRFGRDMLKTKEEFLAMSPPDPADPDVRADLVFFETVGGGAVFSTGSIAWAGSLAHAGYANDVSRITANVVRRFLDPEPFVEPPAASPFREVGPVS